MEPVIVKLSTNKASVRKETFNGRVHTVLPAVIAVAGVLNGAKLTAEELGKFPSSWNGRSIPLLHPQQRGEHVSANAPDILQRAIGTVFNTVMEGEALKAEFWIDDQRMDEMGESALLAQMVEGTAVIDVSTAYFADTVVDVGEFKGKPHEVRHENLRPDHVALLPGEEGACSVEDGCGVPRVNNRSIGVKVNEALSILGKALGFSVNCQCEEGSMDLMKVAGELVANGKLTAKQFEALQGMDEEQRGMVGSILGAITEAEKAKAKAAKQAAAEANAEEEEEEVETDEDKKAKANAARAAAAASTAPKTFTEAELNAMVDKRVEDRIERSEVKAKLLANKANAFSEEEIDTMSIATLKKYEESIRPADYSGQGGFNSNSGRSTKHKPLLVNGGVLSAPKQAEK